MRITNLVVAATCAVAFAVTAPATIVDNFDDLTIGPEWVAQTPGVNMGVTEGVDLSSNPIGDVLRLHAGGYLGTANEITGGPLDITGEITFRPGPGGDRFYVTTRWDSVVAGNLWPNNSLTFGFQQDSNGEFTASEWNGGNYGGGAGFAVVAPNLELMDGNTYSFQVTDDGSNWSMQMTYLSGGVAGPSGTPGGLIGTASINGTYAWHPGDHVAIHNYNALGSDVDVNWISIVPEPGTLGLLALGGATMLLRRRRSA